MADGEKVKVDPTAFDIKEGKLYLNYNRKIQSKWRNNKDDFIQKADKKWKAI